jgi:predicted Holliday junction resolvase-like endonuclease
MIEYILGVALILSLIMGGRVYFNFHTLRNARLESQEVYENLLFSIEREREGNETTMDRMQINITYLQEENLSKMREIGGLESVITEITSQSEEKTEEIKKQKGRAASAHTTKGQILEKWCPFLEHPDIDPDWEAKNWQFMGQPIDYIIFDWRENKEINVADGKVIMLDVKSGKSQLTTKQRRIRDLIQAGRVEWKTIRLE